MITKLKREKQLWWARLSENDESKSFAFLFVSLITANLRALRTIQGKTVSFFLVFQKKKFNIKKFQDAIRMLVELSTISDSSVAIDRILPYFVHLWMDPETQVRATAVTAVAELLAPIQPKTYEESLVFVDYLFPHLVRFPGKIAQNWSKTTEFHSETSEKKKKRRNSVSQRRKLIFIQSKITKIPKKNNFRSL